MKSPLTYLSPRTVASWRRYVEEARGLWSRLVRSAVAAWYCAKAAAADRSGRS